MIWVEFVSNTLSPLRPLPSAILFVCALGAHSTSPACQACFPELLLSLLLPWVFFASLLSQPRMCGELHLVLSLVFQLQDLLVTFFASLPFAQMELTSLCSSVARFLHLLSTNFVTLSLTYSLTKLRGR